MRMDPDTRLVAAAGGVARYFADAVGLDAIVVSDLQSAIVAVCIREAEQLSEMSQRLEVTLTRTPDRIEVAVSRRAPEASGSADGQPEDIVGVDQIEHEIRSDMVITRLTKYVSESASGD
jgi:hypothetical protein